MNSVPLLNSFQRYDTGRLEFKPSRSSPCQPMRIAGATALASSALGTGEMIATVGVTVVLVNEAFAGAENAPWSSLRSMKGRSPAQR